MLCSCDLERTSNTQRMFSITLLSGLSSEAESGGISIGSFFVKAWTLHFSAGPSEF